MSEQLRKPVRFKPTRKYWRKQIIDSTIVVVIGLISLSFLSSIGLLSHIIIKGFVLFCIAISVIGAAFRFWIQIHAELVLDQTHIKGNTGLKSFQFAWNEVVAISKFTSDERDNTQSLLLFTQEYQLTMALTGFDETAVWQTINEYAPPTAIESEAYKRLDHYQNYKREFEEQLPLTIKASPFSRIFYVVVSSFLLFATFMSLQVGYIFSVICGFFSALIIFETLLLFTELIIDNERITSWKLWRIYEIEWADVNLVEIFGNGHSIVFYYGPNRLIIPTRMWRGKQKEAFAFLFEQQVEERQIEVKNCRKWIYPQL